MRNLNRHLPHARKGGFSEQSVLQMSKVVLGMGKHSAADAETIVANVLRNHWVHKVDPLLDAIVKEQI